MTSSKTNSAAPGCLVSIVAAVTIVLGAAAFVAWPFLFPRSLEAHVNAPVTVVRAPVAGIYTSGLLRPGDTVREHETLGTIDNDIIDSQFLKEMRTREATLVTESEAVEREIADLEDARATLTGRLESAKSHVASLVNAQITRQEIQIRLAATEIERLTEEVEMKRGLAARDLVPINDFNRLAKELESARLTKDAEEAQLALLKIEAEAIDDDVSELGGGVILPLKMRLSEYDERLSTLKAREQALSAQLTALAETITPEADRIRRMQQLPISSPIRGRVWRIRARNSEFVNVGDPLAEVIRCDNLIVSAIATERTFNRLEIGRPVTFESAATDRRYDGEIIQLQGPASGTQTSGFAILSREESEPDEYRMIIGLSGFPEGEGEPCPVGQTGRVYFSNAPAVSSVR